MAILKRLGKYEIIRLLGRGSFGEVYEARHPDLEISRAIKVPFDQQPGTGASLREAVLQARLNHANIVQVLDVERAEETLFIVMEHCPGGNLRNLLEPGSPIAPELALQFIEQIANALAFAHSQDIIHRDLKPENVLLANIPDKSHEKIILKITDFGLARVLQESFEQRSRVAGTLNYMAPEHLDGEAAFHSDLWSLGAIFYEMITGKMCFDGETPWEIMNRIKKQEPALPSGLNPDVPPGVEEIVLCLLMKDPEERYKTAGDLIEELKILEGRRAGEGARIVHERPSVQPTLISIEWPCFQGNARRTGAHGHLTNLSLKEKWRCKIGRRIYSAPACSLGVATFGANDGKVYGVDAETGEIRWAFETGRTITASPVISNGRVFIGSYDGRFYCLDMISGERVWQAELKAPLSSAAVLHENSLFVGTTNGTTWSLDKASGDAKLITRLEAPLESSPAVSEKHVFFADQGGTLHALSSEGYDESWVFRTGERINSSPSLAQVVIYLGTYDGVLYAVHEENGQEQWRTDLGDWIVATPCISNGKVIVGAISGPLKAFQVDDQSELWQVETPGGLAQSPSVAWPWVIFGSSDGYLHVVDGESGHEHHRLKLGGFITTPPTIFDDTVYVGCSDGCIYAFE